MLREQRPEFFRTEQARQIGDQVLEWQRITGGWPKNVDMVTPMTAAQHAQVLHDKQRRNDSTTDNDATTTQITFLARLYQQTHDGRYRNAFRQGVEYLLSGQYPNGGWPQFWPVQRDYQIHITYNDDAMVHTLTLLQAMEQEQEPYGHGLVNRSMKRRIHRAVQRGLDCILATQIITDGQRTVWCQQHDRETLLPAQARAYELPSYCTAESAGIVALLMQQSHPSALMKEAIHGAMRWFDQHKLTGQRVDYSGGDTRLVEDDSAPALWARFYDLQQCLPFVCDRDGIPRRHLHEIGSERRNGYAWYVNHPGRLYSTYRQWVQVHDPGKSVLP